MNKMIYACMFVLLATVTVAGQKGADYKFSDTGLTQWRDVILRPSDLGKPLILDISGFRLFVSQIFNVGQYHWINESRVQKKKFSVLKDKETVLFSGILPLKNSVINYESTASLDKSGIFKFSNTITAPQEKTNLNQCQLRIALPNINVGESISISGRKIVITEAMQNSPWKEIEVIRSSSARLKINAGGNKFTINILKCRYAILATVNNVISICIASEKKGRKWSSNINIDLSDRKKKLKPKVVSGRKYCGTDFWSHDHREVPRYELCRNLIQNPSFENGWRYWHITLGSRVPSKVKNMFEIDSNEHWSGTSSMRIRSNPYGRYRYLSTLPLPVKQGAQYTVSFYAKTDRPGSPLSVGFLTYDNPVRMKFDKKVHKSFNLSSTWRRYSATGVAPLTGGALYFVLPESCREGSVWIDGVQFEHGNKTTEYAEKPVSAELKSNAFDNVIENNQPVNGKLLISTTKGNTGGKLKLRVRDFHGNTLFYDQYQFKSDARGKCVVNLPLEGKIPLGLFTVRVEMTLDNGFYDTDIFRISRLKDPGNYKHKNIFGFHTDATIALHFDSFMERLSLYGYGTLGCSGNSDIYPRSAVELAKIAGINYTTASLSGVHSSRIDYSDDDYVSLHVILDNLNQLKPEDLSESYLKKFTAACTEKAEKNSWVKIWALGNEINGNAFSHLRHVDVAKLCAAAWRGVKQAGNDRKFALPSMWNMMSTGGIAWQEQLIQACKLYDIKWDFADIHTYRKSPEAPDLEDDFKTYFEMLKRNGLEHIPILLSEGGFYRPLMLQEWHSDPYYIPNRSAIYMHLPSYDLGYGELLAAALSARSWIITLKYADKIKLHNMFTTYWRGFIGADLNPTATLKAVNTLATLLGNADFKADIRFAPYTRCYIFEDEQRRPVAALWNHEEAVARKVKKMPVVQIDFGNNTPDFFDLMGSPLAVKHISNENVELPLGPLPIFIRGRQDSLSDFVAALNLSRVSGITIPALDISTALRDIDSVTLIMRNLLSRPFHGSISTSSVLPVQLDLNIAPSGSEQLNIKLMEKISTKKLSDIKLPFSVKNNDTSSKQNIKVDMRFEALAVRKTSTPPHIDGKLDDWNGIPSIQLKHLFVRIPPHGKKKAIYAGQNDFDASFKMTWDGNAIYLAVITEDNIFTADKRVSIGETSYDNDSVQVFFDSLGNAATENPDGSFGPDDYMYNIFVRSPKRRAEVFRGVSPDIQLSSGLKNQVLEPAVKVALRREGSRYIWEMVFPARILMPMLLQVNSSFGFGIMVNDHDGDYLKWSKTTSPSGTECYGNTHLFPRILLIE